MKENELLILKTLQSQLRDALEMIDAAIDDEIEYESRNVNCALFLAASLKSADAMRVLLDEALSI